MMNTTQDTPIEVPIRTDERGLPYIQLQPLPWLRSVAIGYGDALTLWASNARTARRAAALGDVDAWAAAIKASEFFLQVAIELNPQLETLRAFPPPVAGQGEA